MAFTRWQTLRQHCCAVTVFSALLLSSDAPDSEPSMGLLICSTFLAWHDPSPGDPAALWRADGYNICAGAGGMSRG